MDFYDILDQVIVLLKQRGRASYRALKVQFHLDNEALEALKEELLYAHAVVDDQGRGLVWTGDGEETIDTPAPPPQSIPSTPTQATPSVEAVSPVVPSRTPEAERRQLTVMFCDLVDSTKLSSQLDPEEYREVVRAYQRVCTDVIQRYDGHIAQLLGDGLLIYFGFPVAHEDDAQRAVHTGLEIIEAIEALNTRLEPATRITLAVRLGIHTGLVVVGEMGGEGRYESLALGEVPNVCSRIQGLAAPNTIAVSEATYRLVEGYFTCESLGEHTLRGVSQPLHIYRMLGVSSIHSRLEVAQTRGLTPLVGRESEVTLLLERWEQGKAGHGQVVLLSGEAGIGKSRLIQTLKDHIANEPHTRWECRSAEYSQNTALFPLVDLFQRLLQFQVEDTSNEKWSKLELALSQYRLPVEETVPLFAPLLSLPVPDNRYPSLNLSPQRQRQKTLETIVAILLELAEHQPVLFIVEDLHWTDPTTLEFLGLLVEQVPTAAIYTLLTCRPHFQPSWHHRSYITEMTLNRLAQLQVERMVERIAGGKALPTQVVTQISEKTDGVPLFVEELTKAVLEAGVLQEVDGQYVITDTLSSFTIPATLQDSLMARLDRLVTAKAVAQYAAVIGRQFPYELLQAVSQLDESTLQRELGRLVEAEIVYQRGLPPQAYYFFKHALIQDAAYQSLLKSTRQQYHRRIAEVLEAQFPETVEAQPELLAHHYTEAGLTDTAVHYWYHAGQSAVQRSAHVEAIAHLRQGLQLLETLPETPQRLQREVDMLIALGASSLAVKGYAATEVGETYIRAQHLCEHLDNPQQLFPILRGLWIYHLVRAEYQTAHALGEQLLSLAQHAQDSAMLVAAHRALGTTLFHLGAIASAHTHFAQGRTLYAPRQHHAAAFLYGEDAGMLCHSFAPLTLWYLGYPDQGMAQNQQAVTLAQQSTHLFSLSFAWSMAAMFHQFRREMRAAQEHAEAAINLTQEQGFSFWLEFSSILRGWALAQQGQAQVGIEQIHQNLIAHRTTGAEIARPYYLALLAEAYGVIRQPEAGLTVLAEGLTLADSTEEHLYESELYRLKGELLLQQSSDHQAEAESCFHHAITIARSQQAKSFELRTATSLARLWQQQGKREEARQVLGDVYNWFTEGFDTPDLKDAKALLDELS
jgi:class 3 adenylate cyclase/predicted ATPase